MSDFKKVINIIPLTRVAIDSPQIFTYAIPSRLQGQLRPGHLVKIPFGKRTLMGVVSSWETSRLEDGAKHLKLVEELVSSSPVLTMLQLKLAEWAAHYYVCSQGLVLKTMLPKIVKKISPPKLVGFERYNPDFILTEYQRKAVAQISSSLGNAKTFLLHGIIGSGKTEIYLQVIERVLESGQQVIMLVPEISLTEAAIERFSRRFGIEKIAAIHSGLKNSEKFWMWQKIRTGDKPIIIGTRSAIFSPVQKLGLIIIDEEHDPCYKQSDQNPRYDARTVARKLSELWQCPLVFGDATPSVEIYAQAIAGKVVFLNLPYRIKADVSLPKVIVVDLRQEARKGNFSGISEVLKLTILETLRAKQQVLLFLNRRGTAPLVVCPDCGYIPTCLDCSINLVWHAAVKKLFCRHCGKKFDLSTCCPICQGTRIKFSGIGTQLVESELKKILEKELPKNSQPVIARMDRDTTLGQETSSQIYRDWASGKIQILIGTQMISKGWNTSRVGLVGIISADTILSLPDFRANERTYELLTQIAGRTGRTSKGLVILQTFNPENYALQAVKTHNYEAFFQHEIKERQKFLFPPFSMLVKLVIKHRNESQAQNRALMIYKKLLGKSKTNSEIIGPSPAFYSKLRGKYHYYLVIKIPTDTEFSIYEFLQDLPSGVEIDVDPESLL